MPFSNNGRDTFDEAKQYLGVRLQCGVPILDRDWNEAEDIRRYFEHRLRRHYLGDGVPDERSFRVLAAVRPVADDFLIAAGRCLVAGYDLWNPRDVLYSAVANSRLPVTNTEDRFYVYVRPEIRRITAREDANLQNAQDINLETCVRDKLAWTIIVLRDTAQVPAGVFHLATITRPAGARQITQEMIQDTRRTCLNLRRVVDENAALRTQVAVLESRVNSLQFQMEEVRRQIARMFWDVTVLGSATALFGEKVTLRIKVVNGLGEPVINSFVAFSTDWGALDPASAVTDSRGEASAELLGVDCETPPLRSEIGVLGRAVERVKRATLANPGTVKYDEVALEPEELALVSRYAPQRSLLNLSAELPRHPIVAIPPQRTATVTVHAKDAQDGVVRGLGTYQVHFGMWLRDWARTQVTVLVHGVGVGYRVGDLIRSGVTQQNTFQHETVLKGMPGLFDRLHEDTYRLMKTRIFTTPEVDDNLLGQAGVVAQTIAQEATASIGQRVNQNLEANLKDLERQNVQGTGPARVPLVQRSSEISAGMHHYNKQRFNVARK